MAITAGSTAPSFKLFNTDRKEVSLSDFTGKILVMHFFPAAFSSTCTRQMCTNRDELSFYNDLNASVVAISTDMPYSLKEFKEKHNINFDLLSDANKRTIHDYDMYHCNFSFDIKGVAKRGVVVINGNGLVIYSEETEHPGKQVDFAALKKAVEKASG